MLSKRRKLGNCARGQEIFGALLGKDVSETLFKHKKPFLGNYSEMDLNSGELRKSDL